MSDQQLNDTLKVKFCGMTREQDVELAVSLGVDAIGMILKADSPRHIGLDQANRLRKLIPDTIKLVGVFVNPSIEDVSKAADNCGIDLVQLHGEESPDLAQDLSLPVVKAIRARSLDYIDSQIKSFTSACAFLIDPYVKGQHGGTGKQLNAELWPQQHSSKKLILAGGLSPANVLQAIGSCAPYGVDLNSGLEDSPGIKNHDSMRDVMALLRA